LQIKYKGVSRLHNLATDIGTEVKEQTIELDHLGHDIENANEKMNTVQAQLEKLLKTKDSCQIWTVVILAVILIILGFIYFIFKIILYCLLLYY
jgi:t-SNARE complex subunit (syntaxin)